MPYKCEDCGCQGARMNSLFEIRLCINCSHSLKYKLICKSKAFEQYKLISSDIISNPIKEYYCRNPYWKSGPPMTLYLEYDIQRIFFIKYDDIIKNELLILNPYLEPNQTVKLTLDYLNDLKLKTKLNKFEKILKKLNLDLDTLPKWVSEQLISAKNGSEYESILFTYIRFRKLYKKLKEYNLNKYIDHKICHDYIYQNYFDENQVINLEQIPYLILFILNKKKLLKNAIKSYNLPKTKYKKLYSAYINCTDTSTNLSITNDLDTLVKYIKEKEFRFEDLNSKLNVKGLVLRSDSVLCSKYLEGNDDYSCDEIVDIMEQMNWFFSHTNYSYYCRKYAENKKKSRYSLNYNYDYDYNSKYCNYSDSDSNSNSECSYYNKKKEIYNKEKSDFVKRQCIEEWIKSGKNGVKPPDSLNILIKEIENKLD